MGRPCATSASPAQSRLLVGHVIDRRATRLTSLKAVLRRHEQCEWSLTPGETVDRNEQALSTVYPCPGAFVVSIQCPDTDFGQFVRIATDVAAGVTVVTDWL